MGKKGAKSEVVSATVPKELYAALKAVAEKEERTISFVAGRILRDWFDASGDDVEVGVGVRPTRPVSKLPARAAPAKTGS